MRDLPTNMTPPPFAIGAMAVQRIIEMHIPFKPLHTMFPDADPQDAAEILPQFSPWAYDEETGSPILTIQSYLVRTAHHTILIDTCIGCDKTNTRIPEWGNRTDRGWLERLAKAGVRPEEVDFVFCTHLHVDHSGWNTQLLDGRWVPTFPNAKYIFSKVEYEHNKGLANDIYRENVLPVVEAGQALMVDTDHAFDDQIWLEHTPGHTPGHVAVHLCSGEDHALMWGDMAHSPMQCLRPHWWFMSDSHPKQGIETRRRVFEDCCEHNRLVLPSHFPAPSVGRIDRDGDAFRFRYDTREK